MVDTRGGEKSMVFNSRNCQHELISKVMVDDLTDFYNVDEQQLVWMSLWIEREISLSLTWVSGKTDLIIKQKVTYLLESLL